MKARAPRPRGQASVEYASISVLFSLAALAGLAGTPVARGLLRAFQEYVDYLLYAISLPL